jgi:hypothetical protein
MKDSYNWGGGGCKSHILKAGMLKEKEDGIDEDGWRLIRMSISENINYW